MTGPSNVDDRAETLRKALSSDRVLVLSDSRKEAALRSMIAVLARSAAIQNPEELADAVFSREELMSTGVGLGLAVPHVRLASVSELVMAVGISPDGLDDYGSLDDKPVHLVFLIAAPQSAHAEYLRLLSAISSRAKLLNGRLLACETPEVLCNILLEGDRPAEPAS